MPTQINASLHPAQSIVHKDAARFRVVNAGRRWGKTRLGVMECLQVAINGGRAWWVAPSYKIAQVGWRPLQRLTRRVPGAIVRLADMSVTFSSGGEVAIRSAENPDSLRGEGLDFVVLDECAQIKQEAWGEVLRPALSDKLGKALFIGTPKGRNWFWEIYQRGIRKDDGYSSHTYPTSANPHILQSEIDAARKELPEMIFRQEYLAEFIDDSGGVFRRVQEAARVDPVTEPQPGRQYTAGVDVAASIDYTVVTVMDVASREAVYIDRFNRVDYNVLIDRLEAVYRRFGMDTMKIESNSIGQPVIDAIQVRGMNVIPFMTTSATKQAIIQNLQAAFENGEIGIINDPVLIGELLSFESKRNASGSFGYSAPDGMHDDCVMSLAIAWDAVNIRGWSIA